MKWLSLHHLPPVPVRAIIINVGTEIVSTLAIASVLRHAKMPLLVVNCTSTDNMSKAFFDEFCSQSGFDLIDLPLNSHGAMIDRLVQDIAADQLLLVDSDAELLSPDVLLRMQSAMQDDSAYGSGFVQHSGWLSAQQSGMAIDDQDAPVIYVERPWIPFALFRTSYVRAAIANGASMRERFYVGLSSEVVVASELLQQRSPAVLHADTGGEVHGWMRKNNLHFEGPDVDKAAGLVNHLHGVTRSALMPDDQNATSLGKADQHALDRLQIAYADQWQHFVAAADAAQSVS